MAQCLAALSFQPKKEEHHLQTSLLTVLRVINSLETEEDEGRGEVGDPEVWAPARLFRALRAHGWVANYGEQDAHEFFQTLFATLEDELRHDSKLGQAPLSLLHVEDEQKASSHYRYALSGASVN